MPSRRRYFPILALFTVLAGCSAGDSIPWVKDYEGALREARMRQMPVITYLFTDWCTYCREMEVSTFRDDLLTRDMRDQYLWVKLNAETDAEGIRLRDQFGVSGYPTIVVQDPQGQEMDRMEGYIAAEDFKKNVERFLTGPDSFGRIRALAEQQPNSLEALYALGLAYVDREDFPAAVEQFQKILEKGAGGQDSGLIVPSAYYYLSYSLASLGSTEEAMEKLDELASEHPDTPVLADALALRGQLYLFQGKNFEAKKTFRQYLDAYPDHGNRDRIRRIVDEMNAAGMGSGLVASH